MAMPTMPRLLLLLDSDIECELRTEMQPLIRQAIELNLVEFTDDSHAKHTILIAGRSQSIRLTEQGRRDAQIFAS